MSELPRSDRRVFLFALAIVPIYLALMAVVVPATVLAVRSDRWASDRYAQGSAKR